jgi:nicotinamidase-related amidase
MSARELPIPPFYDPANAARHGYAPDQQGVWEAARGWRAQHGVRPAAEDAVKVHLLLIDLQKDFCFPEGSLFVGGRGGRGAMEDVDRVARFVYRNLATISEITCTLDTHFPFQIFFASFWEDEEGRPLAPHREVTTAQVREGRARPARGLAAWLTAGDDEALRAYALHYTEALERAGKYALYLWPPHCILGSDGHALAGVVHEARLFHAYARLARNGIESKGAHPLTEHYSALAPEVATGPGGAPLEGAERNTALITRLLEADAVVVAGEAASHCVKATVDDLLGDIGREDPALARKVWLLGDCMSSVAVPDGAGGFAADYTAQAEAALERFRAAGMHVVDSTTPMVEWGIPGIGRERAGGR